MKQMEAEGEKKIPALGWNRSGQGRFQTHQVERHKGLPRGWRPLCCFACMRALRIEWRGAADPRQERFRSEQGREAVPSSFYLSCPVPCLSVRIRDRSQINIIVLKEHRTVHQET